MNDFFRRLAERTLGVAPHVTPTPVTRHNAAKALDHEDDEARFWEDMDEIDKTPAEPGAELEQEAEEESLEVPLPGPKTQQPDRPKLTQATSPEDAPQDDQIVDQAPDPLPPAEPANPADPITRFKPLNEPTPPPADPLEGWTLEGTLDDPSQLPPPPVKRKPAPKPPEAKQAEAQQPAEVQAPPPATPKASEKPEKAEPTQPEKPSPKAETPAPEPEPPEPPRPPVRWRKFAISPEKIAEAERVSAHGTFIGDEPEAQPEIAAQKETAQPSVDVPTEHKPATQEPAQEDVAAPLSSVPDPMVPQPSPKKATEPAQAKAESRPLDNATEPPTSAPHTAHEPASPLPSQSEAKQAAPVMEPSPQSAQEHSAESEAKQAVPAMEPSPQSAQEHSAGTEASPPQADDAKGQKPTFRPPPAEEFLMEAPTGREAISQFLAQNPKPTQVDAEDSEPPADDRGEMPDDPSTGQVPPAVTPDTEGQDLATPAEASPEASFATHTSPEMESPRSLELPSRPRDLDGPSETPDVAESEKPPWSPPKVKHPSTDPSQTEDILPPSKEAPSWKQPDSPHPSEPEKRRKKPAADQPDQDHATPAPAKRESDRKALLPKVAEEVRGTSSQFEVKTEEKTQIVERLSPLPSPSQPTPAEKNASASPQHGLPKRRTTLPTVPTAKTPLPTPGPQPNGQMGKPKHEAPIQARKTVPTPPVQPSQSETNSLPPRESQQRLEGKPATSPSAPSEAAVEALDRLATATPQAPEVGPDERPIKLTQAQTSASSDEQQSPETQAQSQNRTTPPDALVRQQADHAPEVQEQGVAAQIDTQSQTGKERRTYQTDTPSSQDIETAEAKQNAAPDTNTQTQPPGPDGAQWASEASFQKRLDQVPKARTKVTDETQASTPNTTAPDSPQKKPPPLKPEVVERPPAPPIIIEKEPRQPSQGKQVDEPPTPLSAKFEAPASRMQGIEQPKHRSSQEQPPARAQATPLSPTVPTKPEPTAPTSETIKARQPEVASSHKHAEETQEPPQKKTAQAPLALDTHPKHQQRRPLQVQTEPRVAQDQPLKTAAYPQSTDDSQNRGTDHREPTPVKPNPQAASKSGPEVKTALPRARRQDEPNNSDGPLKAQKQTQRKPDTTASQKPPAINAQGPIKPSPVPGPQKGPIESKSGLAAPDQSPPSSRPQSRIVATEQSDPSSAPQTRTGAPAQAPTPASRPESKARVSDKTTADPQNSTSALNKPETSSPALQPKTARPQSSTAPPEKSAAANPPYSAHPETTTGEARNKVSTVDLALETTPHVNKTPELNDEASSPEVQEPQRKVATTIRPDEPLGDVARTEVGSKALPAPARHRAPREKEQPTDVPTPDGLPNVDHASRTSEPTSTPAQTSTVDSTVPLKPQDELRKPEPIAETVDPAPLKKARLETTKPQDAAQSPQVAQTHAAELRAQPPTKPIQKTLAQIAKAREQHRKPQKPASGGTDKRTLQPAPPTEQKAVQQTYHQPATDQQEPLTRSVTAKATPDDSPLAHVIDTRPEEREQATPDLSTSAKAEIPTKAATKELRSEDSPLGHIVTESTVERDLPGPGLPTSLPTEAPAKTVISSDASSLEQSVAERAQPSQEDTLDTEEHHSSQISTEVSTKQDPSQPHERGQRAAELASPTPKAEPLVSPLPPAQHKQTVQQHREPPLPRNQTTEGQKNPQRSQEYRQPSATVPAVKAKATLASQTEQAIARNSRQPVKPETAQLQVSEAQSRASVPSTDKSPQATPQSTLRPKPQDPPRASTARASAQGDHQPPSVAAPTSTQSVATHQPLKESPTQTSAPDDNQHQSTAAPTSARPVTTKDPAEPPQKAVTPHTRIPNEAELTVSTTSDHARTKQALAPGDNQFRETPAPSTQTDPAKNLATPAQKTDTPHTGLSKKTVPASTTSNYAIKPSAHQGQQSASPPSEPPKVAEQTSATSPAEPKNNRVEKDHATPESVQVIDVNAKQGSQRSNDIASQHNRQVGQDQTKTAPAQAHTAQRPLVPPRAAELTAEATRPDVARPNAARPYAARPNEARPNAVRPDVSWPDVAQPDATHASPQEKQSKPSSYQQNPGKKQTSPEIVDTTVQRRTDHSESDHPLPNTAQQQKAPQKQIAEQKLGSESHAPETANTQSRTTPANHERLLQDSQVSASPQIPTPDRKLEEPGSEKANHRQDVDISTTHEPSPRHLDVEVTHHQSKASPVANVDHQSPRPLSDIQVDHQQTALQPKGPASQRHIASQSKTPEHHQTVSQPQQVLTKHTPKQDVHREQTDALSNQQQVQMKTQESAHAKPPRAVEVKTAQSQSTLNDKTLPPASPQTTFQERFKERIVSKIVEPPKDVLEEQAQMLLSTPETKPVASSPHKHAHRHLSKPEANTLSRQAPTSASTPSVHPKPPRGAQSSPYPQAPALATTPPALPQSPKASSPKLASVEAKTDAGHTTTSASRDQAPKQTASTYKTEKKVQAKKLVTPKPSVAHVHATAKQADDQETKAGQQTTLTKAGQAHSSEETSQTTRAPSRPKPAQEQSGQSASQPTPAPVSQESNRQTTALEPKENTSQTRIPQRKHIASEPAQQANKVKAATPHQARKATQVVPVQQDTGLPPIAPAAKEETSKHTATAQRESVTPGEAKNTRVQTEKSQSQTPVPAKKEQPAPTQANQEGQRDTQRVSPLEASSDVPAQPSPAQSSRTTPNEFNRESQTAQQAIHKGTPIPAPKAESTTKEKKRSPLTRLDDLVASTKPSPKQQAATTKAATKSTTGPSHSPTEPSLQPAIQKRAPVESSPVKAVASSPTNAITKKQGNTPPPSQAPTKQASRSTPSQAKRPSAPSSQDKLSTAEATPTAAINTDQDVAPATAEKIPTQSAPQQIQAAKAAERSAPKSMIQFASMPMDDLIRQETEKLERVLSGKDIRTRNDNMTSPKPLLSSEKQAQRAPQHSPSAQALPEKQTDAATQNKATEAATKPAKEKAAVTLDQPRVALEPPKVSLPPTPKAPIRRTVRTDSPVASKPQRLPSLGSAHPLAGWKGGAFDIPTQEVPDRPRDPFAPAETMQQKVSPPTRRAMPIPSAGREISQPPIVQMHRDSSSQPASGVSPMDRLAKGWHRAKPQSQQPERSPMLPSPPERMSMPPQHHATQPSSEIPTTPAPDEPKVITREPRQVVPQTAPPPRVDAAPGETLSIPTSRVASSPTEASSIPTSRVSETSPTTRNLPARRGGLTQSAPDMKVSIGSLKLRQEKEKQAPPSREVKVAKPSKTLEQFLAGA